MSLQDTLDAIQAAIVSASGLSAGKVIWGFQNADQPELNYVSLSLSQLMTLGIDSVMTDYDGGRDAGAEIGLTVSGVREVGLEVSVFTAALAEAADALWLAEKIRTSLVLPSIRSALATVAVVPFDPGPVQYIPEVVSVGFRGRAIMTIRCYMPAPVVVEYIGYIAEVQGTKTVKGGLTSPHSYNFDYTDS